MKGECYFRGSNRNKWDKYEKVYEKGERQSGYMVLATTAITQKS